MSAFRRVVRRFTGLDTEGEVNVFAAGSAFRRNGTFRVAEILVLLELQVQQLLVARRDVASPAAHQEPACRSFQFDAGDLRPNFHHDTVGKAAVDFERRCCIPNFIEGGKIAGALNLDRAGVIAVVRPLGNVNEVRSPVGQMSYRGVPVK